MHADHEGHYFEEESAWNPRIFCWLKSDSLGRFNTTTIHPGRYFEDGSTLASPHVHFSVSAEGYRDYNSEFLFEGDDYIHSPGLSEILVARLQQHPSGSLTLHSIDIPIQPK